MDRRRLAFIGGMIISAVFLFLALRGLKPEQVWSSLGDVHLSTLIIAAIVYFIAVIVIALRWQFLLRAIKLVPLNSLSQLVFIGYMGNNVYPLRAGDGLRIVLLRRNHAVPLARVTTVVIIERLFDGCVMIAFILFSLRFIDLQSAPVEAIVAVTTPLFAATLLLAFFLAKNPRLLRRYSQHALRFLPGRIGSQARRLTEDVIAGLEGLRNPLHLVGAIISSFVTWGIEAGTYWLVMFAFGLEFDYAVALLLVGAVNLAGLIPASPGQVGVNEFVIISILTALNLPAADATAYAVTTHLVIWLPVTLVGFLLATPAGHGLG